MFDLVTVPSPDASMGELVRFAGTYNGYTRFCSNPNEYETLFVQVERRYFDDQQISDALQIDFLRAWLFLLYRRDYLTGPTENADELALWGLLVERIAKKSGGSVSILG